MQLSFRRGFYAGLLLAIIVGLFLWRLWQPERQVQLHSQHLLEAVESGNWNRFDAEIDPAYADQWGNDRALLLGRLREVVRYAPHLKITAVPVGLTIESAEAQWSARITLAADENELTAMMKQRINTLDAPFEFHWRRASASPWDWKLVGVRHPALDLPANGY